MERKIIQILKQNESYEVNDIDDFENEPGETFVMCFDYENVANEIVELIDNEKPENTTQEVEDINGYW